MVEESPLVQVPVVKSPSPTQTIVLAPSYWVPAGIGAIALGLGSLNPWVGLVAGLFALFLFIQATILRLHFTDTALEVYRGQTQIRYFPYDQWLHWQIFWEPVPILFYFKEIRSIHFLPILFNAKQLKAALLQHCSSTRSIGEASTSVQND
ncbi:DUF3119 family protein [Lyngbya confervoides]|uniref:DUF3119 family protein n=1 Tax=Lyngbya confervoides BDU141951 TaxID=1574623 RepID=A0ABD4T0K3_9CYAN|nr:DUF3119 family protein [Lyngbya confervoides]MCM1982102.1 DUF3119 family protein [Lyngbya confervoides BDU141951]